jgi:hypothetical protein
MSSVSSDPAHVVTVRSCDGCTLCCRVLEAVTLDKPMGVLCKHCVVGTGCGVHATRVDECRNYHCGWLLDGSLGEEWRPETAHIIITYDLEGRRLNANADPDFPDAWRQEPYYSQLKGWAAIALERNAQVVAYVGRHTFVILPDRHVDLGIFTDDDYIFIEHIADGSWDARKVNEEQAEELRRAGRVPGSN